MKALIFLMAIPFYALAWKVCQGHLVIGWSICLFVWQEVVSVLFTPIYMHIMYPNRKQGLLSHVFTKPGVYYYSDQNFEVVSVWLIDHYIIICILFCPQETRSSVPRIHQARSVLLLRPELWRGCGVHRNDHRQTQTPGILCWSHTGRLPDW